MALRNELAAPPAGRAWGVPPAGRPAGGVTPCFSRHWRKADVLPLAELDGAGAALVAPQPAAATVAASTTGASRRTDAGRVVDLRNRPVKGISLDSDEQAVMACRHAVKCQGLVISLRPAMSSLAAAGSCEIDEHQDGNVAA